MLCGSHFRLFPTVKSCLDTASVSLVTAVPWIYICATLLGVDVPQGPFIVYVRRSTWTAVHHSSTTRQFWTEVSKGTRDDLHVGCYQLDMDCTLLATKDPTIARWGGTIITTSCRGPIARKALHTSGKRISNHIITAACVPGMVSQELKKKAYTVNYQVRKALITIPRQQTWWYRGPFPKSFHFGDNIIRQSISSHNLRLVSAEVNKKTAEVAYPI